MADSSAKAQAESYLTSLLNKTLRVTTTDTRMFLGQLKCTDSDQNIILSQTFEYRLPPPPKLSFSPNSSTLASDPSSSSPSTSTSIAPSHSAPSASEPVPISAGKQTITQDLTSRYLGLIVVPGEYITKIEVEEFESQLSAADKTRHGVGREKEEGRASSID